MLPTRQLSSLKRILPAINQPIVNQREAQQFLNALKSSFRKHLDDEHGPLHDDSPPRAAPPPPQSRPVTSRHRSGDGYQRPTDRHLRAILSNPLFSYDAAAAAAATTTTTTTTTAHVAGYPSAGRDPLDTFDEAVARGLMNPSIAAGCLMAKRRNIIRSGAISVQDEMAASGAALRVVQWLRASGLERDLSFTSHRRLIRYLVRFMVAEGLDEIVWDWIERLIRLEEPRAAAAAAISASSFMLGQLVAAKAPADATLDPSYAAIVAGMERCRELPHFRLAFLRPWLDLSWRSTVDAWHRSSPSAALHEAFVDLGMRLRFHRGESLQMAHLDLHHPTHPRSDDAVRILQRDTVWRRAESGRDSKKLAVKIMSMGLDTVKQLTQSGDANEAQRIMDLLNEKSRLYLTPGLQIQTG